MNDDEKLVQSGNAVNLEDFASYSHDLNSSMEDTIDFSEDIKISSVVSLDQKQTAALTSSQKNPSVTRDAGGISTEQSVGNEAEDVLPEPVKHKESTLLVDSPLLALQEELAGEVPPKAASHKMFWIALGVLCVLAVSVAVVVVTRPASDMSKPDVPTDVRRSVLSGQAQQLESRFVPIALTPENADAVVNGVALRAIFSNPEENPGLALIDGHDNYAAFYAHGYVPGMMHIARDRDFFENPLEYALVPDDTYQKSTLVVRAPKNANMPTLIYYVNGRAMLAAPEQQFEVVSGFPVFIQVRQQGMGDHLHVVYPTRTKETIQLPDLTAASSAERVTLLSVDVSREYMSDPTFHLAVTAEGRTTTSPGQRRVQKNELIHIGLRKNGRYPLELVLDSTPFGSIYINPYMQLTSVGISNVRFDRKSEKGMTLCFRRASESVCTRGDGETVVPSGKWELVAYRGDEKSKKWFASSAYETLLPDFDYVFSMRSKGDVFTYNIVKKTKRRPEN